MSRCTQQIYHIQQSEFFERSSSVRLRAEDVTLLKRRGAFYGY